MDIDEVAFPDLHNSVDVNRESLAYEGDGSRLLRPDVLEGALGRAQMQYHYTDGDDAVKTAAAAAALTHGVGMAQGFQDGNKRTAFHLTHAFLDANGYGHTIPNDDVELADHIIGHAEGTHSFDDTKTMLNGRLLRRHSSYKEAAWADVMAKAKRLILEGNVTLHRNGWNNIVATVAGDHGVYEVEAGRDDPHSRVVTTWRCDCPWGHFSRDRTRQWKKLEGRLCSHALSMLWKGEATPLDDDATEEQRAAPGRMQQGQPGQNMPLDRGQLQEYDPMAQGIQNPYEVAPPQTGTSEQPGNVPYAPSLPQPPQIPLQRRFDPNDPSPTQQPSAIEDMLKNYPGSSGLGVSPFQLEEQLRAKFPSLFSKVAKPGDFDAIHAILHPEPGMNRGKDPVVRLKRSVQGEFQGGKYPIPSATPIDNHYGFPLYHWKEMGWDPETNTQAWPPSTGPTRTDTFGVIPAGARAIVMNTSPMTRQVYISWSTNFAELHPHAVTAWVEESDIDLVQGAKDPYRAK
jgi:prophage maintenance system killer protein